MGRFGLVELLITLALVVLLVGAHRFAGIFRSVFRLLGGTGGRKARAGAVLEDAVLEGPEPDPPGGPASQTEQTTTESRNEAP